MSFGNMYNSGYGYPITSPYYGNYGYTPQPQQQTQPQPPAQTNTNKVFVSGIDDVRNRQLPFNSDFIFLDNDKPIIYQKIVDGKGQFEVKAFTITPYDPQIKEKTEQSIDLSSYVKTSEFEALKDEIKALKEKLNAKPSGGTNGSNSSKV